MACSNPASSKGKSVAVCDTERKPRILIACCGCVAAVKFGILCRCFSEWGEVKGVVTRASLRFIDKLSIPQDVLVYTDEYEWCTWKKLGDSVAHLELSKWADIMIIAPISANTLGKIAAGLCDNLLTCIVRAWDYSKPLYVAPSMNISMWKNASTERHCMAIDELGISLISPVITKSACGEDGNCAMVETSYIYGMVRLTYELKQQIKNSPKEKQKKKSGEV